MLGIVDTAVIDGFEAHPVRVEVEVANGMPGWQIVGLPEKTVQEAKERVQAAIRNSGIKLEPRKVTVNLAPATHKKIGSHFDLPIAIGILLAYRIIKTDLNKKFFFIGELSLTGELRRVNGSLLMGLAANEENKGILLPSKNQIELKPLPQIDIIGASSLEEVYLFLQEGVFPPELKIKNWSKQKIQKEMSEVKGQAKAKRALEIAAAGGHHLLLIGPPGTGKTMLAERFPSILPQLSFSESLETTKIYSASGELDPLSPWQSHPPFRNPHHTISYAGLIGSFKNFWLAGELSLAHNGVLFLDELPEFRRDVLEAMRQPLESGRISIHRAYGRKILPANIQLIAAMNPCHCGYLGHPTRACTCDPGKVLQYRRKLSGPILDRIDLHVDVGVLEENDLFSNEPAESSAFIQNRVIKAKSTQENRYKKTKLFSNSQLNGEAIKEFCQLEAESVQFLKSSMKSLSLSPRAYHRILKVSRTIADLSNQPKIKTENIAEALQFRSLDRNPF